MLRARVRPAADIFQRLPAKSMPAEFPLAKCNLHIEQVVLKINESSNKSVLYSRYSELYLRQSRTESAADESPQTHG